MRMTLHPALSRYCWISATEQEAVITKLVWEPEKQVRGLRLGCHPAVAGRRKKNKVTHGWHCMWSNFGLAWLASVWGSRKQASPKKRLTTEGSRADNPKHLWLGFQLVFSWVSFQHSSGKLSGCIDVSQYQLQWWPYTVELIQTCQISVQGQSFCSYHTILVKYKQKVKRKRSNQNMFM